MQKSFSFFLVAIFCFSNILWSSIANAMEFTDSTPTIWGLTAASGDIDDFSGGFYLDLYHQEDGAKLSGLFAGAEYLRSNEENYLRVGGVLLSKIFYLGLYGGGAIRLGDRGLEAIDLDVGLGYFAFFLYARPIVPIDERVSNDIDYGLRMILPLGGF